MFTPSRRRKKLSQTISKTPASVTPRAIRYTGVSITGINTQTAAIIVRLRMTGAAAGAANLPKELRMPDWKDTTETSSRKGKVIRDKKAASSILPASSANPGAKTTTTQGITISISNTKSPRLNTSTEIAPTANFIACALPPPTSFCEKIGTKALVKAPSANRLRNRFGNLKATKKASETAPAPR